MLLDLSLLNDRVKRVGEIESGKCFLYGGRAYMTVISVEGDGNVVRLDTGAVVDIDRDTRVEEVELVAMMKER